MALFWNAYNSIIEPLPDKSQWPKVDLPFVLGAPLAKRNLGRYRKLRIKGCLKGGGSKPKDNAKEKATIRGKRCKKCGELGHGQTSYKCKLNGTKKKPKRKARWNTTRYGPAPAPNAPDVVYAPAPDAYAAPAAHAAPIPYTPTRPTVETIIQESPTIVTRRRLAMLMEQGGTSSQPALASQVTCKRRVNIAESSSQPAPSKRTCTKKLTPKKMKPT